MIIISRNPNKINLVDSYTCLPPYFYIFVLIFLYVEILLENMNIFAWLKNLKEPLLLIIFSQIVLYTDIEKTHLDISDEEVVI